MKKSCDACDKFGYMKELEEINGGLKMQVSKLSDLHMKLVIDMRDSLKSRAENSEKRAEGLISDDEWENELKELAKSCHAIEKALKEFQTIFDNISEFLGEARRDNREARDAIAFAIRKLTGNDTVSDKFKELYHKIVS